MLDEEVVVPDEVWMVELVVMTAAGADEEEVEAWAATEEEEEAWL